MFFITLMVEPNYPKDDSRCWWINSMETKGASQGFFRLNELSVSRPLPKPTITPASVVLSEMDNCVKNGEIVYSRRTRWKQSAQQLNMARRGIC
jgi:hypothetical protein